MKSYRNAWAVSLLIVGCVSLVLMICSFTDIDLPDTLMRAFGVLDLISAGVLAFTIVRLKIWKKAE